MPTKAMYNSAANEFVRWHWFARSFMDGIDECWDDGVVKGECYLRTLIERTVLASRENLDAVAHNLWELGDECLRRAAVCHDFDQEVARYWREKEEYDLTPHTGPPPQFPVQPHPWVEASGGVTV